MSLEQRRARARRLNDEDAPDPVEKDDSDDGVDRDAVELDYSGVVEEDAASQDRRDELVKGLSGNDADLDFAEVWSGDADEDPEIDYSYKSVLTSDEEEEREKDAAAIGEAVASELEKRGLTGDEEADADADPDDEDEEGPVEKAGETTADLLDDVQDDVQNMKRAESFKQLAKDYYAAGGSPEDTLPDMLEWYNRTSEATVKVEDGSVELVENAAT